jgi:protein phosphatase
MLTVQALPTEPITGLTCWDAASERGPRTVNADASAAHYDPLTGRWAYVVADGIGDDASAASAARLAAKVAAEVAAKDGPVAGILAAQRAVTRDSAGDAVLVVAVPHTGESGYSCEVAWVGDCRAYQYNGRILEQITVDHTVAEYFLARSKPVTPRMSHLVTTSVRTLRPELIGSTRTSFASGRLVLSSDGVHKTLGGTGIREILDRQGRVARTLVDTAHQRGSTDNATALVVEHSAAMPTMQLAA